VIFLWLWLLVKMWHFPAFKRTLTLSLRASQSNKSRSSSGPTIHELDDSILPDSATLNLPDTELEQGIDGAR